MTKVLFVNEHRSVEVSSGTNLKTLALDLGINPHREFFKGLNCGHLGMCGVCQVWVTESSPGAGAQHEPAQPRVAHFTTA